MENNPLIKQENQEKEQQDQHVVYMSNEQYQKWQQLENQSQQPVPQPQYQYPQYPVPYVAPQPPQQPPQQIPENYQRRIEQIDASESFHAKCNFISGFFFFPAWFFNWIGYRHSPNKEARKMADNSFICFIITMVILILLACILSLLYIIGTI